MDYPIRLTAKNYPELTEENLLVLSKLRNLCTKAKHRKRDCEIDEFYLFDIWKQQSRLCVYSGIQMTLDTKCYNTVSLDRIDSTKDYLRGNVQLVCSAVNKMKQEYSEELFIHLCTSISNHSQ